jgi:prophage regulatory protein
MKLLRLRATMEKSGKNRSDIYRDPTFPKPIKIGPRASAWIEEEVDRWIAARIAASRDKQLEPAE